MPGTFASSGWSRRITSEACVRRTDSGLRLISIRPLFSVAFVPSTPMKDDRLSTAGSCRITFASACWRSAMAANDAVCGASEMPWMTPVSCTGKKPFGTTR